MSGYVINPATGAWIKSVAANVFKTAVATASGDNAIWTPASGKKFVLLKATIEATGNLAINTGGILTMALRDNTTAIGATFSVFAPGTAGTTFSPGYREVLDFGELGYTSTAADQVLNLNLSAALTGGTVRVNVSGYEV